MVRLYVCAWYDVNSGNDVGRMHRRRRAAAAALRCRASGRYLLLPLTHISFHLAHSCIIGGGCNSPPPASPARKNAVIISGAKWSSPGCEGGGEGRGLPSGLKFKRFHCYLQTLSVLKLRMFCTFTYYVTHLGDGPGKNQQQCDVTRTK